MYGTLTPRGRAVPLRIREAGPLKAYGTLGSMMWEPDWILRTIPSVPGAVLPYGTLVFESVSPGAFPDSEIISWSLENAREYLFPPGDSTSEQADIDTALFNMHEAGEMDHTLKTVIIEITPP